MFAHHREEQHRTGAIAERDDDFAPQHFFRNHPVLHDRFREELVRFVGVLRAHERAVEDELEQRVVVEQRQASGVDFFD